MFVFSLSEFPWPPGVHHNVDTHLDRRQRDTSEKQVIKSIIFKYYLLHLIKRGDLEQLCHLEVKQLILKTKRDSSSKPASLDGSEPLPLICLLLEPVKRLPAHGPAAHPMSCLEATLDTRDSELLPHSCSASWKLHSMAISVLGSSEEKRTTTQNVTFSSPACELWRLESDSLDGNSHLSGV